MLQSGFHFEPGRALVTLEGREIPVILALVAAAVAVEVFLALKQDRRLGLTLPGGWLVWTLGAFILRLAGLGGFAALGEWGRLLAIAFAVENVLTLLLLMVYGLCRMLRRNKTARQMEKIKIVDL